MSKKHIAKAHDHFFRRMMSDKVVASTFFEAHLPNDVLAVTDLTSLELQSSSYIDDMRRESIADMLFKTVVGGHTAYLYLLVDHQSRPDQLMPFRLLKSLKQVFRPSLLSSVKSWCIKGFTVQAYCSIISRWRVPAHCGVINLVRSGTKQPQSFPVSAADQARLLKFIVMRPMMF